MRYWLMKSEPDVFGIEHLAKAPKRTVSWAGVRNYQEIGRASCRERV